MNTANVPAPSNAVSSATNVKPLWAAVGVLSVSVLALGAALVHVQNKPDEPMITETAAQAGLDSGKTSGINSLAATSAAAIAAQGNAATGKPLAQNAPTQRVAKPTQPKPVARTQPSGSQQIAQAPLATQPVQQREICATCGTVEGVTPITRKGQGTGLGAVGGAVLGGVVGHQVGSGRGNDLATVVGAVGGGVLGHQAERSLKKTTVYQVRVRMDDGSVRTIEQASAPAVGAKVTMDGNRIRGAATAQPEQRAQPTQPGMVYTGG